MATRRRGGADLDDLKARLGYGNAPTKDDGAADPSDGATPSAEGAESGDSATAGADASVAATPSPEATEAPVTAPEAADLPSVASPAAPATKAAAPAALAAPAAPAAKSVPASADMPYGEDYANAVSQLESDSPIDFDANAVDPELKAPNNTMAGVLIAAVIALLVGTAFGAVGSTSNQARKLSNAMTAEADIAAGVVRPKADQLMALNTRVADMDVTTFQADFQTHLSEAYAAGELALSPVQLTSFATLMSFDEATSRDLLSYTVATNHLSSLATTHLALTVRDREEIERLMAGRSDTANYGVAIALERILASYQAFAEDPEANPFQPILAERVSYDTLSLRVEGEGDDQREFYDVRNSAGQAMPVLVHDLVLLERDQLLPPSSGETALDRYTARASQIQEVLSGIVSTQAQLLTRLEELGARPTHAAL